MQLCPGNTPRNIKQGTWSHRAYLKAHIDIPWLWNITINCVMSHIIFLLSTDGDLYGSGLLMNEETVGKHTSSFKSILYYLSNLKEVMEDFT